MDFLNYHHLRYFWMVARSGGLTRAAGLLNVSQSTVSAQIRDLEDALGEQLFRRVGRTLELTEVGQHVLSYADEIFSMGEDLLNAVRQRPTSRPLRLRLGAADALPKIVLYQMIRPIFDLPQTIQISCWEADVSDMLRDLSGYKLDIVLADEPAPSSMPRMLSHLLGQSGVSFCADARLATSLRRNFPKSLNGAPALLPMSHSGLRRSLEKWFHDVGIRPRLVGEFYDPATISVMALYNLGFMAVPTIAEREANSRFGFQTIGRTEQCQQQFYAITSPRKTTHPAVVAITAGTGLRS